MVPVQEGGEHGFFFPNRQYKPNVIKVGLVNIQRFFLPIQHNTE